MRFFLFLAAAIGLISFAWARRSFFVRSPSTPPLRNGLGPLGTFFGLALIAQLAFLQEVSVDVRTAAALALFVASQALFWLALRAFGSARPLIAVTPGTPNRLITDGPYRLIRHPFYASYSIYWLAGALAVPNWLTWAGVLVMTLMYYRVATAEEKELTKSALGPIYAQYRQSTGMFFPRVFRGR